MKHTSAQLKAIAEAYVKPYRHNFHLGEEDGFVNNLISFAEHLQRIEVENIGKQTLIDLHNELKQREEVVYIQGIEHSVLIFNDAKELAELYAFKLNEQANQLKDELQQIKLALSGAVDFIEENICTNWSGIKESKELLNKNGI